jgi:DNA-binding CsgD family transcriptional regulator
VLGAPRSESGTAVGRARADLLEREAELGALADTLRGAREAPGTAVLIEGPAGAGKSSLLDWTAATAWAGGLTVLRAAGSPLDASVPFGVVRQLFDRAVAALDPDARAAALSGMAAPSAVVLGSEAADGPAAADLHEAVHAVYWLTVNLTADAGLVLLVDDAHLADHASLRVLEYLARRLEELPVALVLAARPEGVDPDPALTQLRAGVGSFLAPRPLSPAAVDALVRARLGPSDRAFADACHRASGGSPLLVAELLGTLSGRSVAPTADAAEAVLGAAPDGVQRRLAATLEQLGPGARELALAVEVLERAPLELAAALAELPPVEAARLAAGLRAAGLFADEEPLRFVHAVYAGALRAATAEDELSDWHRRAAELLAQRGERPEALAPHLLRTVPSGSAGAVEQLRAAAGSALRRGAPEAACRYLERALAEDPGSAPEPELALELATAQGRAGRWDAATKSLARGLNTGGAGPLRYEMTIALGRAEHFAGHYEDSVRALREAAELAGDEDGREAANADLLALALLDPEVRESVGDLIDAPTGGDRLDAPPGPLATMVAAATILEGRPAAAPAAVLRERLESIDIDRSVEQDLSLGWAVLALDAADGTPEALAFTRRALAAARWRGDQRSVIYHLVMEGWLLYRLGRIHEAHAAATEARESAEALGSGLDESTFTLQAESLCLAHILVERAEPDAALALAAAARVDNPTAEYLSTVRHVEGRAELGAGNPAEALLRLESAGAVLDELRIENPIFNGWRVAAVTAAKAAEHPELAELHAESLWAAAENLDVPSARVRALQARAATIDPSDARPLLEEAVALAKASPYRLDEASALVQLGLLLAEEGDPEAARDPLREALDLADRLGAAATARSARLALVAAGGRPRRAALTGLASLSPAEMRVARLAAAGMKNREIAEHLFITIKTVEMHLKNTYAKLAVKGRDGLAKAFAED